MNDLVSIVVPVYNVEKYLDRCVESIVNQTYKNLEIILVDDGSIDGSSQKCDDWSFRDPRIRVVHKENAGPGMARNAGMEYASGKYIFFFDSDDYVDLGAVQKCVEAAEKFKADTVVFGRSNVYSDGRIEKEEITVPKEIYEAEGVKNVFLPELFNYGIGFGMSAWSKMFNLELIKKHRLVFASEKDIISEDAMFCMEYFSVSERVALLSDNLYYYYKNDKSFTRIYRFDRFQKNNEFLEKCTDKAKYLGLSDIIYRNIAARYHGMTLGTLGQIVDSDLNKKEKKAIIRSIYKDNILKKTLKLEIIKLDALQPRIFWILLKLRCYVLCDFLLRLKHRRNF